MEKDKIEWISIKESLPEKGERVLVYTKGPATGRGFIDIEYRLDDEYWAHQGLFSEITHWMHLPEAPADE